MIFHDDWIETLNTLTPEISSRFLNYIVAYSLTGEEPELEGMEYSLWTRFGLDSVTRLMQIWQKKSLKKSKTNFFDTRQPKTNDDQY